MGIDDVLSLAAGLGEALTSIHTVGLVHRDLKPSNILLNDSGPHIIDFGLALGSEQTRLTTSRVVGTPAYMAPERLRGEAAGPPSDVFSLGATLVFASTGRDLVDDASVYEQVLQIAEGRFTLTDVPSRLRALVVRCVSFHPEDRPTAAELTRFVVALGAVTPGLGVEDVTVKISTKHRAEARAAGIPVRTTPRRNGDPESLPTDDQPADDVIARGVARGELDRGRRRRRPGRPAHRRSCRAVRQPLRSPPAPRRAAPLSAVPCPVPRAPGNGTVRATPCGHRTALVVRGAIVRRQRCLDTGGGRSRCRPGR